MLDVHERQENSHIKWQPNLSAIFEDDGATYTAKDLVEEERPVGQGHRLRKAYTLMKDDNSTRGPLR